MATHTPVFLPGKFYVQRNLAGYRPWTCKESDVTEYNNNSSNKSLFCFWLLPVAPVIWQQSLQNEAHPVTGKSCLELGFSPGPSSCHSGATALSTWSIHPPSWIPSRPLKGTQRDPEVQDRSRLQPWGVQSDCLQHEELAGSVSWWFQTQAAQSQTPTLPLQFA